MKLIQRFGVHSARQFANVNKNLPSEQWDYENYRIKYGYILSLNRFQDDYELISKIGKGKYSEVFQGFNVMTNQEVAIKILKPNLQRKFNREILVLQRLKGHPNIVELYDVIRDQPSKIISLITEKIDNVNLFTCQQNITLADIRYITYEVLKGLKYAHSQGIFHRDLKLQNIIVDPTMKIVKIIDWGLAEFYHDNEEYNIRVASRYFKPPEILVDFKKYNYSFDTWSLGAILAGMIFRKEPFIYGKTPDDQLLQTVKILGIDDLHKYLKKYKIELPTRYQNILRGNYPKVPLHSFRNQNNQDLCTDEALDLLERMLIYDHIERPVIEELMNHSFFSILHNKE